MVFAYSTSAYQVFWSVNPWRQVEVLAPSVWQKAFDFWRFILVPLTSGRRWLHCAIKTISQHGVRLLGSGRRGLTKVKTTLFLQTLVHQCSWSQHVALWVEELGEILWYRRTRGHVGYAGTHSHHLCYLLFHLPDLSVLLHHFVCQTHKGNTLHENVYT